MTTDRTALESARYALTEALDFAGDQSDTRDSADGPVANLAMRIAMQCRDALTTVTAALSSPPVLPPVAWCELTLDGKSIAHFDGKPMVMVGPVGNECHPHALYLAAPQASAPALDDARDAARYRWLQRKSYWYIGEREVTYNDTPVSGEDFNTSPEALDAAIDAAMQQEPRS